MPTSASQNPDETAFPIPAAAADRMLTAMTRLAAAAQDGLAAVATMDAERPGWQHVAAQIDTRLSAVQFATGCFRAGDQAPLTEAASELRFLARDLDGCPFTAAMESARLLLIQVSWQIHAAASGSQASGL